MEYINFILLCALIYLQVKPTISFGKKEEDELQWEFFIPPKETEAQKLVKRGIRNSIKNGR